MFRGKSGDRGAGARGSAGGGGVGGSGAKPPKKIDFLKRSNWAPGVCGIDAESNSESAGKVSAKTEPGQCNSACRVFVLIPKVVFFVRRKNLSYWGDGPRNPQNA